MKTVSLQRLDAHIDDFVLNLITIQIDFMVFLFMKKNFRALVFWMIWVALMMRAQMKMMRRIRNQNQCNVLPAVEKMLKSILFIVPSNAF